MRRLTHLQSFISLATLWLLLLFPVLSLSQGHELADQYSKQAKVLSKQGRNLEAARMYEQSMLAEQASPEPRDIELSNLRNLAGGHYYMVGRFDKAIEHLEAALVIDRRLGLDRSIAISLNNIGRVYRSWGKLDKAIEFYRQALEKFRGQDEYSNELEIVHVLNNIAMVYLNQDQFDGAMMHLEEALKISRNLGIDELIATTMQNTALAYMSQEKVGKALKFLQEALLIYSMTGQEAEIPTILNNIGMIHRVGGVYDEALKFFQQALAFNKRLGDEPGVALVLSNIGEIYFTQRQFDKAIDFFWQSIQLKEKIRRTAPGDIRRDYLASQISTYQNLASAYLRKGDPEGVLSSIEQSRARRLAERIAGIDSKLEQPTLDEVRKGLTENEAILLFSNIAKDQFILMAITAEEIALLEIDKESFLAKSRKAYKKSILMLLEKQRGRVNEINPDDGKPYHGKQKQEAGFETAIHYYRSLLSIPKRQNDARKFGRLLYALLIKPVRERIHGKRDITIIPDGILGFLPFETLVNDNDNYLVQEFNLHYMQSLTINKMLRGREYASNDRKSLLAMGGAVYEPIKFAEPPIENSVQLGLLQQETDRATREKRSARNAYGQLGLGNWSNLPGTMKEVSSLSRIIRDGDILTGDKVSEDRIKALSTSGKLAQYRVIHFATHGLVVQEMPELSAIVLSQFKDEKAGEDGYLRMGEIAELDLAADFVNLSACETGLGKIYNGEGIVGLTQSFLIAGANSIAVSLWQVADVSTARFMTELYKKVQNSNLGYSEAMSEVKRGFIKGDYGRRYQHPFYWSPFVYYGHFKSPN